MGWFVRPFASLVAPWKETFAARRAARAEAAAAAAAPAPADAGSGPDSGPAGVPSATPPRKKRDRGPIVLQVIIACAIALPIIALLTWLLTKSDPIFAGYVHDVLRWLRLLNITTIIGHLIVMIFFLPFVASLIWTIRTRRLYFISQRDQQRAPAPQRHRVIPGLVAAIILISINVLYLGYAIVQFVYLFSGFSGLLPDGLPSYASYARRGFAELAVVAVFNLILILIATKFTRRIGGYALVLRLCNLLLIGLAGVQLVSAFTRLALYTQAYGLTQMRLFVFVFLALAAVVFLIFIAREFSERLPLFKSIVFATLAALVVLNYLVPDALIARYNITHYLAGNLQVRELDVNYLWTKLSVDSNLVVLRYGDDISALGPTYADQITGFKEGLEYQPPDYDAQNLNRPWGYLQITYQYVDTTSSESRAGQPAYYLPPKRLKDSWRNYNYNLWRLKALREAGLNQQ